MEDLTKMVNQPRMRWKDFVFFLDVAAPEGRPFIPGKKATLTIIGSHQGREIDRIGTYLCPRLQPLIILVNTVADEKQEETTVYCMIEEPVPVGFKPAGTTATLRFRTTGVGGGRASHYEDIASVVLDEEIPQVLLDEFLLEWKIFDEPVTEVRARKSPF